MRRTSTRSEPMPRIMVEHPCADVSGGLELARVGSDEQRDPDAGPTQCLDHRLERVVLTGDVEAALGGPLLPALRHQADGVWNSLERDRQHLFGGSHLQI